MHLVCHETIPGTGYQRGDSIKDQGAIDAILANESLKKNFSQVPDGTFPMASSPSPQKAFTSPAAPSSETSSSN